MTKAILKLGNDIVDLSVSRTNLKHLEKNFTRFLGRVFTKKEQDSILTAHYMPKILWAIWAAKEAAYKALKKQFPSLIFSHKLFEVTQDTLLELSELTEGKEITGILLYNKQLANIKWQYNTNFIHCIAVLTNKIFNNWQSIHYNITENLDPIDITTIKQHFTDRELNSIYSEQSLNTRFYAKQFLKSHNVDEKVEIIRINNSPPTLFLGRKKLNHEISISHDGKFMAVCFCKIPLLKFNT